MSNIKELPIPEQVVDSAPTNIDPSVLIPEPPPPPDPTFPPDPTGFALLLFAILAVSEGGARLTRGKT